MSLVNAHNEWDPLEEVIIGTAIGAQVPRPDRGLLAVEFGSCRVESEIPSGKYDDRLVSESEVELEILCEELRKMEVVVRRPEARDVTALTASPDWQSDGGYNYCPRDALLVIGDLIIETPMVLRSRYFEPLAYKRLLLEYFSSGARWLSAPKPMLSDKSYHPDDEPGHKLSNWEPLFDAANVLRIGTDILYLVSDSGNELGGRWLQSILGDQYTVHFCRNLYTSTHIDSTIVVLKPGLVLLNPSRVNERNCPDVFCNWDKIYAPEMCDIGCQTSVPRASSWIGMNILSVSEDLAIVDRNQSELIKLLEKNRIDVLPLALTHSRALGGGFHCVSLDVRRCGTLETYR